MKVLPRTTGRVLQELVGRCRTTGCVAVIGWVVLQEMAGMAMEGNDKECVTCRCVAELRVVVVSVAECLCFRMFVFPRCVL